jgi:hypothetical protein
MPSIIQADSVIMPNIYQGSLLFLPPSHLSQELCNFAENMIEEVFESKISEIKTDGSTNIQSFIGKAKKCKSTFTNDNQTIKLLKALILDRYKLYENENLIFDVPRLRIVPNSSFLSSGISYNYKPHRDTWYGAGQDQINHWMTLANATENSTFYIAPSYFGREINNNSEIFDLDEWDLKYRKLAESNILTEDRPHPVPLADLNMSDRYNIVIPRGSEVVFSGQHLHGSGQNTNSLVRFSIDYRVCLKETKHLLPLNVDCRAVGDYKKYMLSVY